MLEVAGNPVRSRISELGVDWARRHPLVLDATQFVCHAGRMLTSLKYLVIALVDWVRAWVRDALTMLRESW